MVDLKPSGRLSVAASFQSFEQRLLLDPAERARAIAAHNAMTVCLIAAGVATATFLQGSFARKTMRPRLHDIDKVVILPDSLREGFLGRPGGPDAAMDAIQGVLSRHYPSATFGRSRHALKVTLARQSFTFDLVPAFETDGDDDDVLIPNRDTGRWDRSNTRTLIRVVTARNQACGGLFVQQVRMGKDWVARVTAGRSIEFPGLHTESLAFLAIRERLDHPIACFRFLETGARTVAASYTDPTGVDVLSRRLAPGTAQSIAAAFAEDARRAAEAVACAAAGDEETACRLWHAIFGDAFPAPPPPSEASVLATAFGGGSIVGGHVTPGRVGHQAMRPTRSWRP